MSPLLSLPTDDCCTWNTLAENTQQYCRYGTNCSTFKTDLFTEGLPVKGLLDDSIILDTLGNTIKSLKSQNI